MNNIKQAKALIKKYRSITLKEIKENWQKKTPYYYAGNLTAKILTGFGDPLTCTLCKAVNMNCENCIYDGRIFCGVNENLKTYNAIRYAETPKQLLKAFHARANHIEKLLNK